ncbi:hypothetical protein A6770_15000 [Nostoc minutum NIES-26]|uniref:Tyr recombinase domain-containing protein n=1 Tax=Nostoc minutum NIES-26 TaxID=1844469 RepID=A0A367RNQ7_9NOSO|nr:hypothetical protein A6770_15000 [Nostoc minutum NIES-26]
MNPSNNTDHVLGLAQAIATRIEKDIRAGHFDPILKSYYLVPKTDTSKPKTLLDLWDSWIPTLEISDTAKATHYRWVRTMISKYNPALTDISWLKRIGASQSTLKVRLGLIRSCCEWGVNQKYLEVNPYKHVKAQGNKPKEVKPFTFDEIRLIIEGFETLYPHYVPFVKFLITTGCRTSEVIGLRWQHVDLLRGEVVIKESLPRDVTGNGYTRVRKGTKTGSIRHLTLPEHLRSLLEDISPVDVNPDDLVFKSPSGKPIDSDGFRRYYWVRVLDHQGIPYRKPYTSRHTMASHAIEQGVPVTGVAYLLGHTDTTMVIKNYGHLINRPGLPELPIS